MVTWKDGEVISLVEMGERQTRTATELLFIDLLGVFSTVAGNLPSDPALLLDYAGRKHGFL